MNGKRWSPFTCICWLVIGGGAIIEIFGWLAVLIFVLVNVAVALAIGAVAVGSNRESAARRNDETLDRVAARYAEARGAGR